MQITETIAEVHSITPLTDSIIHLTLTLPDYIDYQAGQYLQIIIDEQAMCYSIANAPLGSHQYTLHIKHNYDNPFNTKLFEHIKANGQLNLRLPFGECSIDKLDTNRPLIFMAGGTGFAPINAMIEHLLSHGTSTPFELYWSAKTMSDLYMDEKVRQWQAHVPHFKYYSLLSEETKSDLTALVIKNHAKDIKDWQIVISGPFGMAYAARDILIKKGVVSKNLFSDAFDFTA
jgi:CDP-4-dehydro-6-deoxyglucose reductase